MKLEVVQKKVLLNSGTKAHVGSGWNPVQRGFWKVFVSCDAVAREAVAAARAKLREGDFILG